MKVVVTKDYTEMCKLASRIFAAQITLNRTTCWVWQPAPLRSECIKS